MFFRRRKAGTSRSDKWRILAKVFELADASEEGAEAALYDFLNPAPGARFGPCYSRELGAEGRLYLFEYSEPRKGLGVQTVSAAMIALPDDLVTVSLKAQRKLDRVQEGLSASAMGGTPLRFPNDPPFDQALSLFTRDEPSARELLAKPVRRALKRALCEREPAPTFLLGERQLLLSCRTPEESPVSMAMLEHLASDLLSIYAALNAGSKPKG